MSSKFFTPNHLKTTRGIINPEVYTTKMHNMFTHLDANEEFPTPDVTTTSLLKPDVIDLKSKPSTSSAKTLHTTTGTTETNEEINVIPTTTSSTTTNEPTTFEGK